MTLIVNAHQIVVRVNGETVDVGQGQPLPEGVSRDAIDALVAGGAVGGAPEPVESPPSEEPPTGEIRDMRLAELRALADERGVAHDGLKRAELVELLTAG